MQSDEFFLFAGLIFVAMIIFIILGMQYKYVDKSDFMPIETSTSYQTLDSDDEFLSSKYDLGLINEGLDTDNDA